MCNGKGHIWAPEVPGHCGVTNQTPQKAMAIFGNFEPGDAIMTIPAASPLYEAGQFDRFRATGSSNPFSVLLIRGRNDKLIGAVKEITRTFWLAQNGTDIIEGPIPTLGSNGQVVFASGEGPPAGQGYSVEGVKWDELFVYFSLTSDRNSGISGLPKKLAARRFDVLGR